MKGGYVVVIGGRLSRIAASFEQQDCVAGFREPRRHGPAAGTRADDDVVRIGGDWKFGV
jgi:hypothetical protein